MASRPMVAEIWETLLFGKWLRLALHVALVLSHRYPLPPQRLMTLTDDDETFGWLLFMLSDNRIQEFHIAAVVKDHDITYVVEANKLYPILQFIPSDSVSIDYMQTIIENEEVSYAIKVPLGQQKRYFREDMLGVCTCVAVAKRAVGLYAPGRYTPRSLLDYCYQRHWERHNG